MTASSGLGQRYDQMTTWELEERSFAVRACSAIHKIFESVLYPIGVRGASTVSKFLSRGFKDQSATVRNATGARFSFPAWDSYWGHYFYGRRTYEPEIALLIAAYASDPQSSFLDCGANYGFWSVVASPVLGGQVVAIELSPDVMSWLERNAAGTSIKTLNAAVWSVDGVVMSILKEGPNQSHSAFVGNEPSGVISRSVDSVVAEHAIDPGHLLIKVDCEGAEVHVLEGGEQSAARGAVFILEDHGADTTCAVSSRVLELGWQLAIYNPSAGRWQTTTDLNDVRQMKSDRERGYNVLAWTGVRPSVLEGAFVR